ncbi:hypothetical protein JTE90_018650 [Oedothorax gibbosus]|uniref:Uncharacterized protein n=1 Tax=Oedothorax gibbosus TaxID=931172 RepID=A0AAV6TPW7_9ARAC|nr:hypothetical protein JTE90_018650 [Oedothorax gibbosus]
MMMVASTKCPSPEWTLEYSGVLMAPGMTSAIGLFVCVDSAMAPPDQEVKFGSHDNEDLPDIQEVTAQCGALPCPPYRVGEPMPCVVCTI